MNEKHEQPELPEGIDAETILTTLDGIRESGKVNMYGATPVLQQMIPELDYAGARAWLIYWMRTFESRHLLD